MISKKVAAQIWKIQLKTRKVLSGTMVGDHSSANKGVGFEFDQVREYQQGDDVRFIDWKSTARTGKFLTKQYFEERNHNIMIVLDVSASSFAVEGQGCKFDFMAELASIFAVVAEYGKDNVGLTMFSDKVELQTPIAKGRVHTFNLMKTIFSFKPSMSTTNLELLLKHLVKTLRKKTLIVLISDLIDDTNYERTLKQLQHRHEVVLVRSLSKNEVCLPNVGILPVVDSETGELAIIDTRLGRHPNHELALRLKRQDAILKKCSVDILDVANHSSAISEIVKFFRRRLVY